MVHLTNTYIASRNIVSPIRNVCVRADGQLEFIEGNHAPDFDVMQSPLKVGVRAQLNKLFAHLYGITI